MTAVDSTSPTLQLTAGRSPSIRECFGLLLGLGLMGTADLGLLHTAGSRLLATGFVAWVLLPDIVRFWRHASGLHAVMLWAVLGLSNLLSPLRNPESTFDLAATFLSAAIVLRAVKIMGSQRLRNVLTIYVTAVLTLVTCVRGIRALASGSFQLTSLRVDTSAAGMWKGVVLLSPCPSRRLSARLTFLAFKVGLVFLMFSADRPKIGVLLSLVAALALGAIIVVLHRPAATRGVVLACLALVPVAIGPALIASNELVREYGRRTDFSGRTVLWRATASEAWHLNPVTGVGYRNALTSSRAVATVTERFGRDLGINAVHSVYLQLTAEFGIVGLVLVCWGLTNVLAGVLYARPLSRQRCLAVDALFVFGLCISEPILEPGTIIFSLGCLVLVEARAVLAERRHCHQMSC
jgi:hypothetical protein